MTKNEDCNELDHLGGTFLGDLLPFMKTYSLSNESQFRNIVTFQTNYHGEDNAPSEFLIFYANEETIQTILHLDNYLSKHLSSFDLNQGLLLAQWRSIPHATAAIEFDQIPRAALRPMGLDRALKGYGAAMMSSTEDNRGKAPDSGWGTKRRPPDQADRPSVVLEVAYSETEIKLQSDVRFWLSPKDGNVNACLTILINRSKQQIRVEQWHRDKEERIRRTHVVWITKTTTTSRLAVTGDPLRLSFEDLFRRKAEWPEEYDLEIPVEELKELARTAWDDYDL